MKRGVRVGADLEEFFLQQLVLLGVLATALAIAVVREALTKQWSFSTRETGIGGAMVVALFAMSAGLIWRYKHLAKSISLNTAREWIEYLDDRDDSDDDYIRFVRSGR